MPQIGRELPQRELILIGRREKPSSRAELCCVQGERDDEVEKRAKRTMPQSL